MSVRVMALVFENRTLPSPTKFVLLSLADHANEYGESIYPSVETIMGKTALGERTVRKILGELRAAGLLLVKKAATRYRPTEYAIDLKKLVAGVHVVHPSEPAGVQDVQGRGAGDAPLRGARGAPKSLKTLTIIEPSNDIAGVPPASAPDPVKELAKVFEDEAKIKLPEPTTKSGRDTVGVTWWHPLGEMVRLANGSSEALLRATIAHLVKDDLTLSSPKSCLKTFISLHAKQVRSAANQPELTTDAEVMDEYYRLNPGKRPKVTTP